MPKIIACHPAEIANRYASLFARFLKVEVEKGAVLVLAAATALMQSNSAPLPLVLTANGIVTVISVAASLFMVGLPGTPAGIDAPNIDILTTPVAAIIPGLLPLLWLSTRSCRVLRVHDDARSAIE